MEDLAKKLHNEMMKKDDDIDKVYEKNVEDINTDIIKEKT